ncbi:hypothetical protein HDU86_001668 [Geranomyces michiganensis]|nr:hypothetical protein HDU86_001668 [Geranomyces michiganensis]
MSVQSDAVATKNLKPTSISEKSIMITADTTKVNTASKNVSDPIGSTELREKYKDYMSQRDYAYFHTFSLEDRRNVLAEAKQNLQAHNVEEIKMQTYGTEFLGIVSHELRTPLNGLIGVIDLMRSDELSPNHRLYITTLEQSCTHLLTVVSRMQDLAALQCGTLTQNVIPFDIVATIIGIAESMQHMSIHTAREIQVVLDLDPELPLSINGDQTKVQQILANLVGIATISSQSKRASLKATFETVDGHEGKIDFVIKGVQTKTPTAVLEGFDLKVSSANLFEPLSPNNLSQGAVICREFLAQLGSHLEMKTEADDTLIFKFSLNFTYEKQASACDENEELMDVRSAVKILLAEDNKVSRLIAKTMLSKLGFTDVDEAENGEEALDKLNKKPYDMILMDCDMPVMDGYEATHRIRAIHKNSDVKIVALTANSTNDSKQRCIAAGMNDYFTKPIIMKTLAEMLHKWLRQSSATFCIHAL